MYNNFNNIEINSIHRECNILSENSLGIIGISPFSSFFTTENIMSAVKWVDHYFKEYYLFIPDLPTVYSLQSVGYDKNKAIKKSRKQCRYLINKCEKALLHVKKHRSIGSILVYEKLNNNSVFESKLTKLLSLYGSSVEFKEACDEFSIKFLEKNNIQRSKEAIRYSSMYLIYELPMFLYVNQIFEVEKSFFMYPKCPSIIRDVLTKDLLIGVSSDQDFLEYRINK